MQHRKVNKYLKSYGLSWGIRDTRKQKEEHRRELKEKLVPSRIGDEYPAEEFEENYLLETLFYVGPSLYIIDAALFLKMLGIKVSSWMLEGRVLEEAYIYCLADGKLFYTNMGGTFIGRGEVIPEHWTREFVEENFPKYKMKTLFNKQGADDELENYLEKKVLEYMEQIEKNQILLEIIRGAAKLIHREFLKARKGVG